IHVQRTIAQRAELPDWDHSRKSQQTSTARTRGHSVYSSALPALDQFEVPRSPYSYALEIVNKQSGGHRKTGIGNPRGYSTPALKGVYQSAKAGLLLRSG